MRNYYIEQSSNRYTVYGDVTDWIEVPNSYASYNDDLGGQAVWGFLQDTINGWYDEQLSEGKTGDEINEYLSQFDVWDRYDYDSDGIFDESDGYIDTFQSVHAGEGEEAGAPFDAIWSHSWYAFSELEGEAGPEFNKLGGVQIGASDFWVGKYTIQPENGGVGVFAHEFGHDLGLPDLYDYFGENGTGFWTLMSSGSWLGDGKDDIGSKPSHMSAWEKFQLGWLSYEVAIAGEKSIHRLGPMEFNTKQAQGVFVVLPQKEVMTDIGDPYAGSKFYYSGSGNNLDRIMYKQVYIAPLSTFAAKVNFDIEFDWDYAYLVVSTNDGVTWDAVETNLSTSENPNGTNLDYGITGSTDGNWVDLTADLGAYTKQNVKLGIRYKTDEAVAEKGLLIDEISITGYSIDGAEIDFGWSLGGVIMSSGDPTVKLVSHYYVCEYRSYLGFDSTLQVGPYYFGYVDDNDESEDPDPLLPDVPDYVDHFAYQDGLLIHYWDTSQSDNNTGLHAGQGLLLPIDAHYKALNRIDGGLWRNRIQSYDSTFFIAPTDGIPNIHHGGELSPVLSLPGIKTFDDRILHYDPTNPLGSVIHPNTGTLITILQEPYVKVRSNQAPFMQIQVSPAK